MLYKLFFSLMSFLLALFFVLMGLLCLIFPWSEMMQSAVIDFILTNSLAISLLGLTSLILGVGRIFFIISGNKPAYYHYRSDSRPVWIDESIIQNYVESYWKTLFPRGSISNRIVLKKNKIFLSADLPYVPAAEQPQLMHKIQKELSEKLALMLGYKGSFTLSATFQPKPNKML
jgi:hypothetical protein